VRIVVTSCGKVVVNDRTADADRRSRSDLFKVLKHRVDHLESLIDFLANFGTSQNNLAADEDQEHDLWFHHSINQTRKQFRFIRTKVHVS